MEIVKSISKALEILNYVSNFEESVSLSQIANNLQINRTTVFRLAHTLEARGYLNKEENRNAYRVGFEILPIAAKLLNRNRLRVESLPYLQKLSKKCEERVNLGILYDGAVLYLAGIDKPALPMMYSRFGKRAPAHSSSLGKIILAHLPDEELKRSLEQQPLLKYTENTITDPERLKEHLLEIRSQGYAIDNQEHLPGVYCISALIRNSTGRGIGSISISSENLEKIKGHLNDLLETAEIISHLMGYSLV